MKLMELAVKILEEKGVPMTTEEIWDYALEKKYNELVNVNGKTPWSTLSAQIYVDMKEENSVFAKVGRRPVRFTLIDKANTSNENVEQYSSFANTNKKSKYAERDLHKVLSYFAFNYMRVYT